MKMTTRSLVNGVAAGSVATLSLAFGAVDRAQAAMISTLFSTGLDSSGNVTSGLDTNYTLTGSNFGSTPRTIAIGSFPGSTYDSAAGAAGRGDDTKSAWIGPNNGDLIDVAGDYTYTTKFDLSGLIASTAIIEGKWNTDNSGLKLILNGNDVTGTNPGFQSGFSTFNLTSGFQSGVNTLAFVVKNDPNPGNSPNNPTALRVEYTSTFAQVDPARPIPEPSDLVGTVFALGSVVALKRKLGKK